MAERLQRLELGTHALGAALLGTAAVVGLLAGLSPKYAVVAAFGLAFVGLVLVDLTLGLCLFAVVIFMDLLPEFGAGFSFSKVAGLLLAASWVASSAAGGRRRSGFVGSHPYMTYVLVLFLGWAALSTLWAENSAVSPGSVSRYVQNAFLFLIVYAAVRERRHVVWLLGAYVLGATLSSLYGFVAAPPGAADERVTGTIGDPNELASVLLPALIFGFVLAATLKQAPVARGLALFASAIATGGLFLSGSRGGMIALAVALLAAVVLGGRWRPYAAIAGLLVVLGGIGWFTLFAPESVKKHVTQVDTTGTGRQDIWKVGLRMWEAHPVNGVGVGNFQTSSVHYLLKPGAIKRGDLIVTQPKVAHNTYLQVLAEMGVVGLVLFLTILLFALWCAFRAARLFARKRDLRMELLARGVLISLIGLLVSYFFISEMYNKQFWLLLGLGPAIWAIARQERVIVEDPHAVRVRPGEWSASPSPLAPDNELVRG